MPEEIIRDLSVDGLPYTYRLLRQPDPVIDPVIVLGGALQGMHGWPQMEDRILPVASMITADLPGMGSAAPLGRTASTEILGRAIDHIIDDLHVPRVNLFGFSYGAELAFSCAQRNPSRIAQLLLGGVATHITDAQRDHWRQALDLLTAGETDDFADMVTAGLLCQDENRPVRHRRLVHRYVKRSILHAVTHSPHATDSLHRALHGQPSFTGGLTGVPTLVFTGEHDTMTSAEHQRAFAETVQDSHFVTINESDHWVILERANEVADLAARFFTKQNLTTADYLSS